MTVFKTFLKILNKNKFIIILYTVILLIFGGFNMQSQENNMSFTAVKPDIAIINNDANQKITNNLIKYIKENANVISIESDKVSDALFYREVNYVIYIPKNYSYDFINGKNPVIDVKKTGDYQSSFAEMLVKRYINVASIYRKSVSDVDVLISKVNETLSKQVDVEITSKLDTNSLQKAAFYYNFESYSILACLIYVICLILSIFNSEKIKKRTIISSTSYKKNNRILLLSNCLYSVVIWLFYLIISFILIGNIMFTTNGIIYMINSFIFTICATTIAFLLGNIISKKETISGIVNVIALGSSFLCGAFVPQDFLPDFVLKIAHFLPTYYYIDTNNKLATLEIFNYETLKPLFINMGVLILFSIVFIVLTNLIVKKKQKIG